MDLQAKIAARRAELAARQQEAERAAEAHVGKLAARLAAEAESPGKSELAEQNAEPALVGEAVGRQIEKLVEKEADRLMSAEGGTGWAISFFAGVALCFITWHGLWLILVGVIWFGLKQSHYRGVGRKKLEAISQDIGT